MPCLLTEIRRAAAILAALAASLAAPALAQANPSGPTRGDDSKLEIYGGYGFWDPIDSDIYGRQYPKIYSPNVTASVTYYFSRHFGIQAEGQYFALAPTLNSAGACNAVPCSPAGQKVYSGEAGPVFRYPIGRFIPYAHALGGGERMNGPYLNPLTWGWGVTGGIGVDYVFPYFNNLVAVRPIQADYEYSQASYGPLQLPFVTNGGLGVVNTVKLSGGLVLRFGSQDTIPIGHGSLDVSCSAEPASVYPGDPVQVTANPMNFRGKKSPPITWTSTGGGITPSDTSASISTTNLAPGEYTVTGVLKQGKKIADCDASFTVKAFEPPILTCTADPSTVPSGGVSTITASALSPSNRPLVYSYFSDFGQITGTGSKVELATAGITAPTINVKCTVTDDLGKSTTVNTQVAVTVPKSSLPPLSDTSALCGVDFNRDIRRPVRVDNEAKACLDDIAMTLQRQPDAKLVIIGNYGPGERPHQGAERSLNVRQYLTDEKGIDPTRIEVRFGEASGRTVDDVLVPAGATYSNDKTTAFDPAKVKRAGQPYGKPGQHPTTKRRRHRRPPTAQVQVPQP